MRELSLFSGAGGGLLGTKLLGWKHCGYVEFNDYCQQIIAQRIKDGVLDEAPIFSDIRAFNSEGFAKSYKGMVDVITAGFPCQPFSRAGKRLGEEDERNMWPETIKTIRSVRPKFVLLENVSAILKPMERQPAYIGRVHGELAEAGYNSRQIELGADDVGAGHHRERIWILAHDSSESMEVEEMVEAERSKRKLRRTSFYVPESIRSFGWTVYKSSMVGRAHDMAYWVDRSKAIGNGQVPPVVATAWQLLTEDL